MSHAPVNGDASGSSKESSRWRLRSTAASALLIALAITQSAGLDVADTKLNLIVNPVGYLKRAWSMWDATGAFGQVGNQAYGYFWPIGPFFVLGDLARIPEWVVQRLWMAFVLLVAFHGIVRLARMFGVRSDLALMVTGMAYALSPRMLTTLGPISIEAWPSALAPWVLLCLVSGSREGSPRRAALGAALATAFVGGVNAAATFAVVPLGVVWLLTRSPGPRRRSLMFWWPTYTLLACLWWLLPLVILGRYSPPFLDYIETADVTTFPTTIFNALRGTSHWIPYIEPRWRSGRDLIVTPVIILNSTVVLVASFLGLVRRDNPQRTFLGLSLLVGLLMVTAGHLVGGGWLADPLHTALDGALSPLRNVHKYDPVIRLPLVLGLGHVVEVTVRSWRPDPERRLLPTAAHFGVIAIALIGLVGSITPALTGRIAPASAFAGVPDYWKQAADWLGHQSRHDRTLLLPGSAFGTYLWGDTRDEPMDPLARAPWAVRNAIPLAPTGNIRVLDSVEERINRGEGSAGLATYFRRMGVRYLLVRNDLAPSGSVTDPLLVHQALAESPGITRVHTFGPELGGGASLQRHGRRLTVNDGWQARYPAIEVYEVVGDNAPAVTGSHLPVVIGAPEDLLTLADEGVLDDTPTRLAYDVDTKRAPDGPVILTDGLRLRDRFFGQVHDGTSPTMTDAEAKRLGTARRDFVLTSDYHWLTRAVVHGAADVRASSSASDANAIGGAHTAELPYAAVDGDARTQWVSAPLDSHAASLTITLDQPLDLDEVTITAGTQPSTTSEVVVRTEHGTSRPVFLGAGVPTTVRVPGGVTHWVEVKEASGAAYRQLSIAELAVQGVRVTRWLAPPAVPDAWGAPDVISLDAAADLRTGCVAVGTAQRCAADRGAVAGEDQAGMRRILTIPQGASYHEALTALPRPGAAVPALLQRGLLVHVHASSVAAQGSAASSPVAAIDGDPGTTWIASATDGTPSLDLRWIGPRRIDSIQLTMEPGAPAARPARVRVSYVGGSQTVSLDRSGRAELEPVHVNGVSITVTKVQPTANVTSGGSFEPVGAGVSEVSLGGLGLLPLSLSDSPHDFGCGSGPAFQVGASSMETAVVASPHDLLLGRPVRLRPCGSETVRLDAGTSTVQLGATAAFQPVSVVLTRLGGTSVTSSTTDARARGSHGWTTSPGGDTLVLRQNENPGWRATAHGKPLHPVLVDGWQQAFQLPPGTTSVGTRYAPRTLYRVALAAGGGILVLLALWWARGRRRTSRAAPPPLTEARRAPVVAAVAWLIGTGLLAGTLGLVVAVVSGALLTVVRQPLARLVLGLAPLGIAGTWYAAQPWAGGHGWAGTHEVVQLLTVIPLALIGTSLAGTSPARRRRMKGASTNR